MVFDRPVAGPVAPLPGRDPSDHRFGGVCAGETEDVATTVVHLCDLGLFDCDLAIVVLEDLNSAGLEVLRRSCSRRRAGLWSC